MRSNQNIACTTKGWIASVCMLSLFTLFALATLSTFAAAINSGFNPFSLIFRTTLPGTPCCPVYYGSSLIE